MTEALEPSEEIGCVYMNTHTYIMSSCRHENRNTFLNKYCATPRPSLEKFVLCSIKRLMKKAEWYLFMKI